MNRLKRYILSFIILFINAAYLFANIGSRGRFDTPHSAISFKGIVFLLVIVIIGIAIYLLRLLYLKFRNHQEHKLKKETITKNSDEWIRQRNEEYANQLEGLQKEAKESRKGCIFGAILFGGGIIWSIVQTDTEWLEAGKDLLITFGGLAVVVGVCLLISRIANN